MGGKYSKLPNGDINCFSFVKLDSSADGKVLQCGAGDTVYGITTGASRLIALDSYDSNLCGKAGDPAINIFGPADPGVMLRLGGTVSHGDYLKSDASGYGVTGSTDKDFIGARALAAGTSGKIIPVEVVILERSK